MSPLVSLFASFLVLSCAAATEDLSQLAALAASAEEMETSLQSLLNQVHDANDETDEFSLEDEEELLDDLIELNMDELLEGAAAGEGGRGELIESSILDCNDHMRPGIVWVFKTRI
jgi:hypothetical protein